MASLGLVPISRPMDETTQKDVLAAWIQYTGFPEALSGGVGFLGFNIVMQGGQAKVGMNLGLYKGSYLSAFKKEFLWGTIIMASILTIIDPEHLHGSGLDETKFYQEHLEGSWTNIKASAIAVVKEDPIIAKRWL